MKNRIRFIISIILIFTFVGSAAITSAAVEEDISPVNKFYTYNQKILSVSYRGDTELYPENSIEAIESAFSKGADFVSVCLDKTKDGVFYLCERESLGNICNAPYEKLSDISSDEISNYNTYDIYGNITEYRIYSLFELIENTDSKDGIILDILPEDKDAVYNVLNSNNALDRMIIRVNESASELNKWINSKNEKVNVIAVYDGNIIFNTITVINTASDENIAAVQYQSKNYFNVAYGDFFANRYLTPENARAVAATYSPDFCGQRGDGADCWNELIKKGYSVIETNNIESLVSYIKETESLSVKITALLNKAFYVDPAKYSEVSLSNLNKAKLNCETIISGAVFSLDEAQRAYSKLLFALEDMKISTGEVDTRGALNITAGKVVASIVVGAMLLAGQIYVYKMRKKSKEK